MEEKSKICESRSDKRDGETPVKSQKPTRRERNETTIQVARQNVFSFFT
jgi:hypothetical protein